VTRFLDLRYSPVGGGVAGVVGSYQGTSIADYAGLDQQRLLSDIRGRHVLIGTHGFNVNRADGIEHLSNWETLLQLSSPSVFIGVLWPGDSIWAQGLDYAEEPHVANETGEKLAAFLNITFTGAASISFASHSLGARVVLQTIAKLTLPVRRVILMAGAIDDNCLSSEFRALASKLKIEMISVLASKQDKVLSMLFPLGNLLGGIIAEGHPWWHAALGHSGPSTPRAVNFQPPFEIPSNWKFDHGDYLKSDPASPSISLPEDVPPDGTCEPGGGSDGWQEAFTAAFCSTRFR